MMRRILIGLLLALPVQAAVYKWMDDAGNVHYSDTPPVAGAQQLDLPEFSRYAPRALPAGAAAKAAAEDAPAEAPAPEADAGPASYQRLQILQPEQNGTVRSSDGIVEVQLAIEPPLGKTHYVTFTLDGARASQQVQGTAFTLSDVERGSHVLQASVVDESGRVLRRSDTVRFTMRQDSLLMRQQQQEPDQPDDKPAYAPEYQPEAPDYTPEKPDYTPQAPDYKPEQPNYTPQTGGIPSTPGQTNPAFAPNYTP